MALAPWNVLASGKIRTDAEEKARAQSGEKGARGEVRSHTICRADGYGHKGRAVMTADWMRTESERKVCKVLERVAAEIGAKSIQAGMYDGFFHPNSGVTCAVIFQSPSRT